MKEEMRMREEGERSEWRKKKWREFGLKEERRGKGKMRRIGEMHV